MNNQGQKLKYRQINLSQTAEKITSNQPKMQSIERYRRPSLPNSIGHYSMSIRNRVEQPNSDIYFNSQKKSKFMKQIVDNYFEETLQKIYGNQKQAKGRELQALQRNIKNIAKRSKILYSTSIEANPMSNKKDEQKIITKVKVNNHQGSQQQHGELFPSLGTNANASSFLPPIYQSQQDVEDLGKVFPELSEVSPEIRIGSQGIQKTLIYENDAFRIYIALQNNQPKYRVKQYKLPGLQILKRQQRALKYEVNRLWKESQINANSFVSELVHPLKNLICKITPHHQGNIKFKIRSAPYRKYLLANNCSQLRHFIRQICGILKKIQGKVLNNKINPSNIFVLKGNKICIGEWGYSSFRQQYQIQENKFESRINPILKSSHEWLATPQYLSPQLLNAVLAQSDEDQPDIWQYKSKSDIWSLGITLFEILTMTPIWISELCSCKLKTKKPVTRTGLMGTQDRKLTRLAQKQKKLQKLVGICLQNQIQEGIDQQIVNLISRMIVYDPDQRISLDQIISVIK